MSNLPNLREDVNNLLREVVGDDKNDKKRVANLNEDYEGSEFYCRGKEIKLKTGDILLFPSNFMYPHEVKEATKGVRYSFVSWAF